MNHQATNTYDLTVVVKDCIESATLWEGTEYKEMVHSVPQSL